MLTVQLKLTILPTAKVPQLIMALFLSVLDLGAHLGKTEVVVLVQRCPGDRDQGIAVPVQMTGLILVHIADHTVQTGMHKHTEIAMRQDSTRALP